MSWFDWFATSIKLPEAKPLWSTPLTGSKDLELDDLKAYAESDGTIKIDVDGTILTIKGIARHAFLNKIRKAVEMADVADPDNDQLNSELNR